MTTRPRGVPDDFRDLRESYGHNRLLDPSDLAGGWWALLTSWIENAASSGAREPNAMVVATCAVTGGVARPSSRTVLCKGVAPTGVRFYTTRTSRKGRQLAANPFASATFPLLESERQVHLEGEVVPLDDDEGRRYWATRSRESRIAAWASSQSEPVTDAEALLALYRGAEERFGGVGGDEDVVTGVPVDAPVDVPMPPYWGGYELRPERAEFWQGGAGRFHDRLVAELREGVGESGDGDGGATSAGAWTVGRLQP